MGQERSPGPGRPRDLSKRRDILKAGRRLFFRQGFEAVTMESVAAEAGVSKLTVYRNFHDKATLFEEVVKFQAAEMSGMLQQRHSDGVGVRETLTTFGVQLMSMLTHPDLTATDRIIAAEVHRHPDLARRFFAAGPGHVRGFVGELIASAARRGELRLVAPDTPLGAAEDLIGLWQGLMMLELRFGIAPAPSADELHRRIARGVDVFLRAYSAA